MNEIKPYFVQCKSIGNSALGNTSVAEQKEIFHLI